MSTLEYKKDCDLDVIVEMLKLNPLWDDFKSVQTMRYDGIRPNIIIDLKRSFYSHEKDQITAIVESYSSSHPLKARSLLEDSVSIPAMIVGKSIVAKYAAMNLYKNKTALQVLEIMDISSKMITCLLTGSLELALYELKMIRQNPPASGSITVEECDEFIRRLEVEIKILKGA